MVGFHLVHGVEEVNMLIGFIIGVFGFGIEIISSMDN